METIDVIVYLDAIDDKDSQNDIPPEQVLRVEYDPKIYKPRAVGVVGSEQEFADLTFEL